ncbi:MAG: hypothetical protein ABI183_22145, partial [Polyangiaceae bacterium]
MRRAIFFGAFSAGACALAVACGGGDDSNGSTSNVDAGAGNDATTSGDGSRTGDGSIASRDGGLPSGWLYTSGNKIFVSSGGATDTQWMGRGVNMDDLFLCGHNSNFTQTAPTGEEALTSVVTHLISDWKPTFIRVSLSMNTYVAQTWI